jgi:hypothetical protein
VSCIVVTDEPAVPAARGLAALTQFHVLWWGKLRVDTSTITTVPSHSMGLQPCALCVCGEQQPQLRVRYCSVFVHHCGRCRSRAFLLVHVHVLWLRRLCFKVVAQTMLQGCSRTQGRVAGGVVGQTWGVMTYTLMLPNCVRRVLTGNHGNTFWRPAAGWPWPVPLQCA